MKLFAAMCLLVFSAFTAKADLFVISAGTATVDTGTMQWSLSGSGNGNVPFAMNAVTHSSSQRILMDETCPCSFGNVTLYTIDNALNHSEFSGTPGFSINGVFYPLAVSLYQVTFTTAPVHIPQDGNNLITLTVPFTFSTQFQSGNTIAQIISTGRGIASVMMVHTEAGYVREGPITYTFLPYTNLPEPASLILLGSGLLLLVRKIRK